MIARALALHGYRPSGSAASAAECSRPGEKEGQEGAWGGDAREALTPPDGFETAALTGAYLACAKMGKPVLIDGFISTAAALTAERICPGTRPLGLSTGTLRPSRG